MELISHDLSTAVKKVPTKPIIIAPLGDIQWGSKGVDKKRLKEHVQRLFELGDHVYFVFTGDLLDFASPSNRQALRLARLYDTTIDIIEDRARDLIKELLEVLKPTKGRVLGAVSGHHYFQFQSGINSDQIICDSLGAPYLGHCGFIRIEFVKNIRTKKALKTLKQCRGGTTRGSIHLWVHHGVGSGQTVASPLNKLEKLAGVFDADIYLMGHYHRTAYSKIPHIKMVGSKVVRKTKHLVVCGSFMEGYVPFHRGPTGAPAGSYVEQKMLVPVELGAPIIKVWPHRRSANSQMEYAISVDSGGDSLL